MHTTDTVDFEVVLSGEVILDLDDGAERFSAPGRHGGGERDPPPLGQPGK